MKTPNELPPFGSVPNQLGPVQSDYSDLSMLFGEMNDNGVRFIYELQSREPELARWIAADPQRATLLQTEPQKVIPDLLRHLGMDERELRAQAIELPPGWALDILQIRKAPVGTNLMQAVWSHLNADQQSLLDFQTDPFAVITAVAISTGATTEEHQAVGQAFSTVLGIATLSPDSTVEWTRSQALVDGGNFTTAGILLHRK